MTLQEAYSLPVFVHQTYCGEDEGFKQMAPIAVPWDDEGWVRWDDVKRLIEDKPQ